RSHHAVRQHRQRGGRSFLVAPGTLAGQGSLRLTNSNGPRDRARSRRRRRTRRDRRTSSHERSDRGHPSHSPAQRARVSRSNTQRHWSVSAIPAQPQAVSNKRGDDALAASDGSYTPAGRPPSGAVRDSDIAALARSSNTLISEHIW